MSSSTSMPLPSPGRWPARTAAIHRPPIAKVTSRAAVLRQQGRDIIDLGQAVVSFPPPGKAVQAAHEFVDSDRSHLYSPDLGLWELRQALAEHVLQRKGATVSTAEHLMVTCGANQAYANALLSITRPGDEVITLDPGYFDHGYTIRMAGCTEVAVPFKKTGQGFEFDVDAIEKAITPRTSCITLVTPGNPTGAVADRQVFENLLELCKAKEIWLVSDETYDAVTFGPEGHVSGARWAHQAPVIVLGSFSKVFAMAAWRIGYMFAHPDVIAEAFKVQDALVVCAPVPGQEAVLRALATADEYFRRLHVELSARRRALVQGLEQSRLLRVVEPRGGTFAMAQIRGGGDDLAFSEQLLEQQGVVVIPGSAFGPAGRGYVRISFGNQSSQRIAEAAKRLERLDWPLQAGR